MPSYPTIRLAAFQPDRPASEYTQQLQGLVFPLEWRQKFLEFYRIGKRKPESIHQCRSAG